MQIRMSSPVYEVHLQNAIAPTDFFREETGIRATSHPSSYSDSLRQESERLLTHHNTILLCRSKVLGGNVCVTSIWRVVLAIGCKALRDADTRAVELTHNPLLLGCRCALRGCQDEVCGPPQRQWFICKVKCRHDMWKVLFQE